MTDEGRRSRPPRQPIEPAADEEIQIEADDGTVVTRNLTMAERYLRAHMQRFQDNVDRNDSQLRSNHLIRSRIYVSEYYDHSNNSSNRIKILTHLCLFLILGVLILSVIVDESDDISGGLPQSDLEGFDETNLRVPLKHTEFWYENGAPVNVHYHGYVEADSHNLPLADYTAKITVDSRASSLPGIRLSSIKIAIDPPIDVPYFDRNIVDKVDKQLDIDSLYDPDAANRFKPGLDAGQIDSKPHIRIVNIESHGLHVVGRNEIIYGGRNARNPLYKPVSMECYESLSQSERMDKIYTIYKDIAHKDMKDKANYYQNVVSLSNPEHRLATKSNETIGFKECDFTINAISDGIWSDTIVTEGTIHSANGFSAPEGAGHSLVNTHQYEKALIQDSRLQRISAMSYSYSRGLQAENDAEKAKEGELQDESSEVGEGGSKISLEVRSLQCPEFNMRISGLALNMMNVSTLFGILLSMFGVAAFLEAVGTLRFLWFLEADESRNSRAKVSIPNLVIHILVAGFEAGTLFSYGMESALYVASFAMASVLRTFVSIVLLIRVSVLCWRLQMTRRIEQSRNDGTLSTNSELTEACRREAHSFVRLLTASSSGGLLVLQRVFSVIPEAFVVLYWMLWIPQIHFDVKHGHQRSLSKLFILSLSISRLYLPFIVWGLPNAQDNIYSLWRSPFDDLILPAIPRSPNVWLWLAVVVGVTGPASLLLLEHYLGSRWFVPVKYLPQLYDYKTRPVLDKKMVKRIYQDYGRPANEQDLRIGRGGLREATKDAVITATYSWKDFLYNQIHRINRLGDAVTPPSVDSKAGLEDHELDEQIEMMEEGIDGELDRNSSGSSDGPAYAIECVICMSMVTIPIRDCEDISESRRPIQTALEQYLPLFLYTRMNRKTLVKTDSNDTSEEEDTWALAPCEHIFHEGCLKEWLEVKMECPMCRKLLPAFVD